MEEWRVIEEFPLYDVSSLGRVRRARGQTKGVSLGRVLRSFTVSREYLVVALADRDSVESVSVTVSGLQPV